MIIEIDSVSQLHAMAGLPAPQHPLISVVDLSEVEIGEELLAQKFCLQLYSIALKDGGVGWIMAEIATIFQRGCFYLLRLDKRAVCMKVRKKENERAG